MFEYGSSGGITVGGCGSRVTTHNLKVKFLPGDVVYFCQKASQGVLERIAIKRINLVRNRRTYGKLVPLYVDSYNFLYNEEELCTRQQALDYATAWAARNGKILTCDDVLEFQPVNPA